jgi:hypothetical protein
MSQNGPPWSRGGAEEPYTEPADPWGDQGSSEPSPAWGGHPPSIPQQPVPYHSAPVSGGGGTGSGGPMWGPPTAPPRRNTPIIALVVTLGVLIVGGLGTTAWLLNERNNEPAAQPSPSPSTAPEPGPAPLGSEDARFYAKVGDCVINQGSDTKPEMRTSACTSGTYKVLQRYAGKATGAKDAEAKCAKVQGYTKWYFYDSPYDDFDFVLCLKEHKAV